MLGDGWGDGSQLARWGSSIGSHPPSVGTLTVPALRQIKLKIPRTYLADVTRMRCHLMDPADLPIEGQTGRLSASGYAALNSIGYRTVT